MVNFIYEVIEVRMLLGSPPWYREGNVGLVIQGSAWDQPRRRQLEKVVNLDENSWTPTKIIKKEKL